MPRWLWLIGAAALVFCAAPTAPAQDRSLNDLAPAVVRVHVTGITASGASVDNWGTGFFVSDRGLVVTAFHVVARERPGGNVASWAPQSDGTPNVHYSVEILDAHGVLGLPVPATEVDAKEAFDVALLAIRGAHYPSLGCNFDPMPDEANVRGIGWRPDQHVYDQISGQIAPSDVLDVGERYLVRGRSAEGNSGGPIVNAHGQVVGVITSGRDGSVAPDNETYALPAEWLETLLPFSSTCRQTTFGPPTAHIDLADAQIGQCVDRTLNALRQPQPFVFSGHVESGGAQSSATYAFHPLVAPAQAGYEIVGVSTATTRRSSSASGDVGFSGLNLIRDQFGRISQASVNLWSTSSSSSTHTFHEGEITGAYRRIIDTALRQNTLAVCAAARGLHH